MATFNRIMALLGFATILLGCAALVLAGELGTHALGWVSELRSLVGVAPAPLRF